MMNPFHRFRAAWPLLPPEKRLSLAATILLGGTIFFIWGLVMSSKSNAPRVILALASVAYTVFALVFFDRYPGVVYIAGFILGGVLFSLFVIHMMTNGKKNGGEHKE